MSQEFKRTKTSTGVIAAIRKSVLVLRTEQKIADSCASCGALMIYVQPTYLGKHFDISERRIFRMVESGSLEHIDNELGQTLVCVGCLAREFPEDKAGIEIENSGYRLLDD